MNVIEVVTLSPGEVHQALNDYVRKHLGKLAGEVVFAEAKFSERGVPMTAPMSARIELHTPPEAAC